MNSQLQDLFEKMGRNIALSAVEQARLRREIQNIEEVMSVFKGLLEPGTSTLHIDNLKIANNDIHMNEFGIFFKNQEGEIGFQDTTKTSFEKMVIYSDGENFITIANKVGGPGVDIKIDTAAHTVMDVIAEEDPDMANRLRVRLIGPSDANDFGTYLDFSDRLKITGEGVDGGYTAMRLSETADPTSIEGLTQDVEARIYVRANKLIIQWNDGGTNRYKYLDLTGTGVTWVHTTSAP